MPTNRFNGNNILDSSADPLCLFVISGSCDFVVWFPFIHRQSKPRRNTNTKPIHTKAASRVSQVCYCRKLLGGANLAYANLDKIGAPGTTRTCDPLIRSQVLYPAELRVRVW